MTASTGNPLLQPWQTPYGLPPFEQIRPEHYGPAFEHAMRAHRAEVDAIAAVSERPTFDNTHGGVRPLRPRARAHRAPVLQSDGLGDLARAAGGRTRDVAAARRPLQRDPSARGALRAHRRAVPAARGAPARPRSSCGSPSGSTWTSCARAPGSRPRPGRATPRSSSASPSSRPGSARTCWPTKRATGWSCGTSAISPACRRTCGPPRARRRRSAAKPTSG